MLTTITPYWNRPNMLAIWLEAIRGASIPEVSHVLFFVGEQIPDGIDWPERMVPVSFPPSDDRLSIGHYHNLGAEGARTEWIMKMDVDTLPNVNYFKELLTVLRQAKPCEWFNGGMVYVNATTSAEYLKKEQMPVSVDTYNTIMGRLRHYCGKHQIGPAATNFICRRADYLELGGCDERFRGYGWEDYQQIFMLERHQLGRDPLPGPLTLDNVTRRCCAEISRQKARALWTRNPWLCLLHHFHPASPDKNYKSQERMLSNKKILLDYILKRRRYVYQRRGVFVQNGGSQSPIQHHSSQAGHH